MSSLPAPVVTDELTRAIAGARTAEEMRNMIVTEAEKQAALADQQKADKEKTEAAAKAAEAAAAPQVFKRTETIGGREFEFEAASELELERMVNNALKVAYAYAEKEETYDQAPDPAEAARQAEEARKAEEIKAAERGELELQLKRGEIDAATFIQKSGILDAKLNEALAAHGINLADVQKAVETTQLNDYEKSWEKATQEFLAQSDWPGGEQNLKIIGLKIAELGLMDADDKVAAFHEAYAAMKREHLVFPVAAATGDTTNDTNKLAATGATQQQTTQQQTTQQQNTQRPAVQQPRTSSSLFGTSSGVLAQPERKENSAEPKVEVPKDATPAEIIDIWKKELLARGQDPNAAFDARYGVHRA